MLLVALLLAAAPAATAPPAPDRVLIPAGPFETGCNAGEERCNEDAQPRRQVNVSEFEIDRWPVRQSAYEACVSAGACPHLNLPPLDERDLPVSGADWEAAHAYCAWAGARLPTEVEWEKAARGTEGRAFPWGNEPGPRMCPDGTLSERRKPQCPASASPYGVLGMGGESEWTADWYSPRPPSGTDPAGPEHGCHRVYRTGVLTWRFYERTDQRAHSFRCASGPAPKLSADEKPLPPDQCAEQWTDSDHYAEVNAEEKTRDRITFGLGVLTLGAIPLSAWAANQRGMSVGRFALDGAGGLASGLALGALTAWATIALNPDKGSGAGPAMGGMASLFLVTIPATTLAAVAGTAAGIGITDRLQTGRWPPWTAYAGAVGGLVLGGLLGYVEFLADRAMNGMVVDLATIVLIPVTVAAVSVGGYALAGGARVP